MVDFEDSSILVKVSSSSSRRRIDQIPIDGGDVETDDRSTRVGRSGDLGIWTYGWHPGLVRPEV